MNASGNKQDLLWNVPIDTPTSATVTAVTTTTTSPLSEGDSEGPQKSILSSSTSTADLLSISASASMFLSDFARFPFPLPPLADLYNLSTNPMASLLLAQVGAAALSSLNQNIPTSSPFIEGSEQGSSRNTFSIAEHIREEVKEGENGEEKEEEREATNVERSRNNNESLCCPICHEDLNSKDLSVHISLELQALDEETQRLQHCRFEQNPYERCMSLNSSGLFDHISSSQRYCKFQMVKERRLARKRSFPYSKPQEEYNISGQQSLKIPHSLESGFSFFSPQLVPNIPAKIRRIEK